MRLLKLLIAVALCMNIPIATFAHSGRTDAAGGHFNHDTGEYHYHHGYSAHQHSDTDGDGIVDCPYSLKGRTDFSNSNVKSSKLEKPREETESPKQEAKTSKKSNKDIWTGAGVLVVCGIVFGLGFIVDGIKCVIDKVKQKPKK